MTRAVLKWAWEAPQSLLGLANLGRELAFRNVLAVERREGRFLVELRGSGAVSLGYFVFFTRVDSRFVRVNPDNDKHEWGHARQSALLGPLYLPIVGVPSVLRVLYAMANWTVTREPWDGYYDGFPEDWADRLGGVERRD